MGKISLSAGKSCCGTLSAGAGGAAFKAIAWKVWPGSPGWPFQAERLKPTDFEYDGIC